MRTIVIETFGDYSVFRPVELPRPTVIPGHVLLEVKATSVNPVDCHIRSGQALGVVPTFPAVFHGDVSGIVVEVGGSSRN